MQIRLNGTVKTATLPVVTIAPKAAAAVTEGSPAVFTVSRTGATTSALTVGLRVADAPNSDFVASGNQGNKSVTIAAGSASADYSVATAGDATDEPNGPVKVTVRAGSGYTVGSTSVATRRVNDNDATPVTLAGTTTAINEGASKTFTLTIGRGLYNGERLSVALGFAGTATRGTSGDYTLACASAVGVLCSNLNGGTATVLFAGPSTGQTATSVTLTLTARADGATESGETVNVNVGTVTPTGLGGGAGTPTDSFGQFTINDSPALDPDAYSVCLTQTVDSVYESHRQFLVELELSRPVPQGSKPRTIGVRYPTTYVAKPGTDFKAEPSSITIKYGQTHGPTKVRFRIPIIDDRVREGNEGFRVILDANNPPGTPSSCVTQKTFYILNDDGATAPGRKPVVTVAAKSAEVVEGENAVFTIRHTGSQAIDVAYAVTSDLIKPDGRSQQLSSGIETVEVPANGSAEVSKPTQLDGHDRMGKVELTLMPPTAHVKSQNEWYGHASSRRGGAAVVKVKDHPLGGPVAVTPAPGTLYEGETRSYTVSGIGAGHANVRLAFAGTAVRDTDTSTAGDDFQLLDGKGNLRKTNTAFKPKNGSFTFKLKTLADSAAESDETIVLSLTASGTSLSASLGTATLKNGARPSQSAACVAPATGDHWNELTGKTRTGGVGAIRIEVEKTFKGNGTLTRAGVCEMARADSRIGNNRPWCGATGHTSDWEAIYKQLDTLATCRGTTTPPVTLTPPATPEVSISAGAAVTEGTAARFTLTATPAPASALTVSVTVAQTGDHAAAGTTGAKQVTIPTGGTASYTVATVDDSADEADGTVSVTVNAGTGYTVASASKATVTVSDDDAAPPASAVIGLTAGSGVTEGTAAGFTLTATPAPAADLAVKLRIAQTGAVAASSALGTRTVTIGAGKSQAAVSVATTGDSTDEADGSVTATVIAIGGTETANGATATVAVADDDATGVTLSAPSGTIVEAGGTKTLTVTLGRALVQGETLAVPLVFGGKATLGTDYTLAAPAAKPQGAGYAHLAGADATKRPTLTFTGPSASSATLVLTATADTAAEGEGETVTAALGTLTATGLGGGASGSGTASFTVTEPPPVVSIAAKTASVTEGTAAAFTLTASRAPASDLTVKLTVSETAGSDFVAAADEDAQTAVIAKGATEAVFSVATVDDATDEPDGTVSATLAAGTGYTVAAAPGHTASVAVADNDVASVQPTFSVADMTVKENAGMVTFKVRLSPASDGYAIVRLASRESNPVSARYGRDYIASRSAVLAFAPGQTERSVRFYVVNDRHDEDPETFEFALLHPRGAAIGDGVAVVTIENDDPMPAAWLARFGRTVAEQALDGIAGRMAAPRTPGMQGAVAGQALSFDPAAGGNAGPGHAPGGAAFATMAPDGTGALALAGVAQAFGGHAEPSGHGSAGIGHGFDAQQPHSRTMTARDALLGSSFSLTGARDGAGGSMAFWGRAAQSGFDGREGTFSLDGEATTAMLGADYARGNWLVGLALAQSSGEGDYRDTGIANRPDSQTCPEDMEAALCAGAVRAGDGGVEASLTAAIPYAALQASERLRLWGVAGYGSGEVTLKTMEESYKADTSWSMAAAGLRGDLLAPPAEGGGPALAVTSDALWTRSSSEKTRELAASDSDATRLRLGLEGSYRIATEGGGHVTPKLEAGMRHDGGDAETGFGVEVGGGIAWVDPGIGLTLDVSGRTLIAHGDDDLEDRGFAASLAWDPAPATGRGLSLGLRQAFGGRAEGGLDALFAPDPLEDRAGGEAASRWSMEAAYGFPAFGGRFTGSPHVGLGLATAARDYTLGWRLAPEAATAPDLSFGLKATRRENDTAEAEHTVGFELGVRW